MKKKKNLYKRGSTIDRYWWKVSTSSIFIERNFS